tara:strand:+ start:190 stop:297 length:108 start_codon:yes stop_codon:yes gene_type:complete
MMGLRWFSEAGDYREGMGNDDPMTQVVPDGKMSLL